MRDSDREEEIKMITIQVHFSYLGRIEKRKEKEERILRGKRKTSLISVIVYCCYFQDLLDLFSLF